MAMPHGFPGRNWTPWGCITWDIRGNALREFTMGFPVEIGHHGAASHGTSVVIPHGNSPWVSR